MKYQPIHGTGERRFRVRFRASRSSWSETSKRWHDCTARGKLPSTTVDRLARRPSSTPAYRSSNFPGQHQATLPQESGGPSHNKKRHKISPMRQQSSKTAVSSLTHITSAAPGSSRGSGETQPPGQGARPRLIRLPGSSRRCHRVSPFSTDFRRWCVPDSAASPRPRPHSPSGGAAFRARFDQKSSAVRARERASPRVVCSRGWPPARTARYPPRAACAAAPTGGVPCLRRLVLWNHASSRGLLSLL